MAKGSSRKNDTRKANRDRRQRLDELRRQQRAAERRKNLLFTGSAIIIAIGLIAGAVIPTYLHDRAKKAKLKTGYQAAPTAAEKVAGCTGVHNDPVSPAAQHVLDKAVDYSKQKYGDTKNGTPPIPPSGGPHSPIPLGDKNRFYDVSTAPRPERAVHNLEHGYVVGWYDAGLPAADVTKLKALAADPTLSTMLFVGWSQGSLPLGKHFVLTSWGRTERCGSVSADVVKSFYRAHVNDKNLAPEVGSGPGPDTCPASQLEVSKPPCSPAQTSPSPSSSSTPTPKHSKKK